MNPFDALWEDRPTPPPKPKVVCRPQTVPIDYSEAIAIYEAYLIKIVELTKQREYADRVLKATHGTGMTPVMPLATMGCNGGPLLCDHCGKPIILEGGKFNKVYADAAWAQNPNPKWVSWIKGGLMVRIVDNGTLRIYHGYEGHEGHCDTVAKRLRDEADAAYVRDNKKAKLVCDWLLTKFAGDELNRVLTGIMAEMFSFDPGLGVNRCG